MELTSKNLEMQKHIFIKMRYIAPEGQTVCRKITEIVLAPEERPELRRC